MFSVLETIIEVLKPIATLTDGLSLSYSDPRNTGDYHDEMTADNFEQWFATKRLPNVPHSSLIVMDNTSYHSHCSHPVPVKSWTKQKMQNWLQSKGTESQ